MTNEFKVLTKNQIKEYILENCTKLRRGFWRVNKPLQVWKKTRWVNSLNNTRVAITALEIPVGATIHTLMFNGRHNGGGEQQKMRANVAIVREQYAYTDVLPWGDPGYYENARLYTTYDEPVTVLCTQAGHRSSFKYVTGTSVKPGPVGFEEGPFDAPGSCNSGIHFFVDRTTAMDY